MEADTKFGIKDSEICGLCSRENDSNEHMLILCGASNALWSSVESWIRDIGIDEYSISNENFLGGELDGSYWVNAIILNTIFFIFTSKMIEWAEYGH